jgi:hypothetical protein
MNGRGVHDRFDPVGQTVDVLAALAFDFGEGCAFGLRLDHADRLPSNEEQVVDSAVPLFQDELTHGHAGCGAEVDSVCLPNGPTSEAKLAIDLDSRSCLTSEVVVIFTRHEALRDRKLMEVVNSVEARDTQSWAELLESKTGQQSKK